MPPPGKSRRCIDWRYTWSRRGCSRSRQVLGLEPPDGRVRDVVGTRDLREGLARIATRQRLGDLVVRQLQLPAEPHAALAGAPPALGGPSA
jgi:hypothetical protein